MASFQNITGRELLKYIKSLGYVLNRQKGNHRVFVHNDYKTLVIPVYKKKMVKVGLLGGILKDIGISKTDFLNNIN